MTASPEFVTFAESLSEWLHFRGYDTRIVKKDEFIGWGDGERVGWLNCVPVSGFSYRIIRLAICHYRDYLTERRLSRFKGNRGRIDFGIELSMHRDELEHPGTPAWLAGYLDARHRGLDPEPPPFELADGRFGNLKSGYIWSKLGDEQSNSESARWSCNRNRQTERKGNSDA